MGCATELSLEGSQALSDGFNHYRFEIGLNDSEALDVTPGETKVVPVVDRVTNDDNRVHVYRGDLARILHPGVDTVGHERMELSATTPAGGPAACILYDEQWKRIPIERQVEPTERFYYFSSMVIEKRSGENAVIDGFRLRKHAFGDGYHYRELIPFPVAPTAPIQFFCFPLYEEHANRDVVANIGPEEKPFETPIHIRYLPER